MNKILALFFLVVFSVTAVPVSLRAESAVKSEPKAIRTTPPAPRFSDAERQAELTRRRAAVLDAMQDKSIMVLFSGEPKVYSKNVYFMYRQENNLYYLTALKQPGAMLVLTKNGADRQEYLFLPSRDPQREVWDGKMYSNDDAARISGVKTIINSSERKAFLDALTSKKDFASSAGTAISAQLDNLYLLLPAGGGDSNSQPEYRQEGEFAKSAGGFKIVNAHPIFAHLRLVKSPYEIKLMQHAVDITSEAQMRAMAAVGTAKREYEVQAEVEYIFRKRNADYWGYPSIVGCGPNATTLHYVESQGEVKQGDLLLLDVGAEYDHYTADVTRTFPVNGKFSAAQAEIYQIVYDAQEAVGRAAKPGVSFSVLRKAADDVIKERLAKLGLISAPDATIELKFGDQIYKQPQFKLWYIHGLGHWLGMNVHDVGDYGAPLKAGMIFTNEPGLYFREDALDYLPDTPGNREFIAKVRPVYEKYKNIGVRIEDDLLVTENGVEWMTKALPRKLSEVEAFIARASKEVQVAGTRKFTDPSVAVFDFGGHLMHDTRAGLDLLGEHSPLSGQTIRRGWIWSGRQAAYANLHHSH